MGEHEGGRRDVEREGAVDVYPIGREEAVALLKAASGKSAADWTERERFFVAGYSLAGLAAAEYAERIKPEGYVVADFRRIGWATMVYACHGTGERRPLPEAVISEGIAAGHFEEEDRPRLAAGRAARPACGWEHRVWLTLGVEGPPALKGEGEEYGPWIPSPMMCGTCPNCEGGLAHVRWNDDVQYEVPEPVPEDAPRFFVPEVREFERLAARGYGGADYVDPTGVTTPGRRS